MSSLLYKMRNWLGLTNFRRPGQRRISLNSAIIHTIQHSILHFILAYFKYGAIQNLINFSSICLYFTFGGLMSNLFKIKGSILISIKYDFAYSIDYVANCSVRVVWFSELCINFSFSEINKKF